MKIKNIYNSPPHSHSHTHGNIYDYLHIIFFNLYHFFFQQIPTDGLVLRGWYTTITLAVYGHLTKAIIQEVPPPGPVQPLPDPRAPPDAIGPGSTAATAEWVQQHAQVSIEMIQLLVNRCILDFCVYFHIKSYIFLIWSYIKE